MRWRTITIRTAAVALAMVTTAATAAPRFFRNWSVPIADGERIEFNLVGQFPPGSPPELIFEYNGASVFGSLGWEARISGGDPAADVRFAGALDTDSSSVHTRLPLGTIVGPAIDDGFGFGVIAYEVAGGVVGSGAWLDQVPGYVGFSFLDEQGERHYGWVEVLLDNQSDPAAGSMSFGRLAYETEPDTPIATGDFGYGPACNIADLGDPAGTVDLADIAEFIFLKTGGALDLTNDGVCDLADIVAFVGGFYDDCVR